MPILYRKPTKFQQGGVMKKIYLPDGSVKLVKDPTQIEGMAGGLEGREELDANVETYIPPIAKQPMTGGMQGREEYGANVEIYTPPTQIKGMMGHPDNAGQAKIQISNERVKELLKNYGGTLY